MTIGGKRLRSGNVFLNCCCQLISTSSFLAKIPLYLTLIAFWTRKTSIEAEVGGNLAEGSPFAQGDTQQTDRLHVYCACSTQIRYRLSFCSILSKGERHGPRPRASRPREGSTPPLETNFYLLTFKLAGQAFFNTGFLESDVTSPKVCLGKLDQIVALLTVFHLCTVKLPSNYNLLYQTSLIK